MFNELLEYDAKLLIYLNNLGTSTFNDFWLVVTNFLYWIPIIFCVLLYITRKYSLKKKLCFGIHSTLVLATILLITEIVKQYIGRIRPCNDLNVNPFLELLTQTDTYSFFSGHAATSFAFTTFVYLTTKKESQNIWLLFAWPLLFAYSRLYLGLHYPSDIFIGTLVGIFIGNVFHRFYNACIVKMRII